MFGEEVGEDVVYILLRKGMEKVCLLFLQNF
jgi:hypothetical protein